MPKVGDAAVFSGVNVLDNSVVTYRPAAKDDVIKVVDLPVKANRSKAGVKVVCVLRAA